MMMVDADYDDDDNNDDDPYIYIKDDMIIPYIKDDYNPCLYIYKDGITPNYSSTNNHLSTISPYLWFLKPI